MIPPPYYPLGEDELVEHFVAAADACAPLPFYLYAFTARSGYPLTPDVIRSVAERATNVAGLKVSESPYRAVAPYLELGLRIYVGQEPLLPQALADGAYGSVSGPGQRLPGRRAAGAGRSQPRNTPTGWWSCATRWARPASSRR